MQNQNIRETVSRCGLKLWQLADAVGISEATLTRWLRFPLTGERLRRVDEALERLEDRK